MPKGSGDECEKGGIRAVAQAAGVSISTVSRVLNNTKPVSDSLRRRVLRAVDEANYVPNHTARSMVYRHTKTVGVVMPDVSAAFHSMALSSIMSELDRTRRRSLVCTVSNDETDEIRYLELFSMGIVDGVILMHETQSRRILTALSKLTMPVVLASVEIGKTDFPGIGIDDVQAAFDATSYLINLGHRNIGLVAGSDLTVGSHRSSGYRKALLSHGIPFDRTRIVAGRYTAASGYEATSRIMEVHRDTTAIFAVSDEMAIGTLRYLKDAGKKVPEDVSVMGFDDIEIAAFSDPALTTVRQPIHEIAKRAASTLIEILEDREPPKKRVRLPYEIVVRQSTASPKHTPR